MILDWVKQSKILLLLVLFALAGVEVILSQDFFAVASQNNDCSLEATEPLYEVDEVGWERHDNQQFLTVKGIARTGGWTGICLYEETSDNETKTFQLRGIPPEGMATQALTSVSTKKKINLSDLPTDEIVVKAETNSKPLDYK